MVTGRARPVKAENARTIRPRQSMRDGAEGSILAKRTLTERRDLRTLLMLGKCTRGGAGIMKFVTIRDLRANTARLRKDLQKDRELVLTVNGRPFALMTPVEPDMVEEEVLAIRRARAQAALGRIRAKAKADGLDRVSMAETEAIIAQVRRERRAGD